MNLLCFLGHLGTTIICKAAWLFYRSSISLIFVCTSSKLSKTSTFNPNITTTYARPPYLSGSNSKRGTIGACALSARTYNAEVQGSDARIRNHFVLDLVWFLKWGEINDPAFVTIYFKRECRRYFRDRQYTFSVKCDLQFIILVNCENIIISSWCDILIVMAEMAVILRGLATSNEGDAYGP